MIRNSKIPALSIRQPWAELILRNRKKIEIRTWESKYRGKVLLHTGKIIDEISMKKYGMTNLFCGGLIGIFNLTAIIPFDRSNWEEWRLHHLSDDPFREGYYAWIIKDPIRFVKPIEAKGDVGLFQIDDSDWNKVRSVCESGNIDLTIDI